MAVVRHRFLLTGPTLLGFSEMFDSAYGNPRTPRPYPKVTPARVGGVLLPFPCPHCGAAKSDVVDPKKRHHYRDEHRGHSWCPGCRGRYVIDYRGAPLAKPLPAGATSAPARVERNGKVEVLGPIEESGFNVLGVW